VAEGDSIPDADPDDSEVLIGTGKVAVYYTVSREQWGTADTASLLSDATRDALVRKANRLYLSQAAPTPPATTPPAGLVNQNLGSVSGTIQSDGLDPVIDAIAAIEDAGGNASHILASPQAWAYISKLKAAVDSNLSLIGAGTNAAPRQLENVPVLVDKDVLDWSLIVLDRRAVLSAFGNVVIATSEHAAFQRDSVAVRATFRFGAQVSDTDRVVLVPVLDLS